MSDSDSSVKDAEPSDITLLLGEIHNVDDVGAEIIWQEYFPKLIRLARKKMSGMPRRVVDEEDVALSAINSFFRGAQAGRFSDVKHRDDLWRLLITITARKAISVKRHNEAAKRGYNQTRGESIFLNNQYGDIAGLGNILDENKMPEFAEDVVRCCEELLNQLGSEKLKTTALLLMEGYTQKEIAEEMGCSVSRTKQRVARIKSIWKDADPTS